jgi:hypothetical protein
MKCEKCRCAGIVRLAVDEDAEAATGDEERVNEDEDDDAVCCFAASRNETVDDDAVSVVLPEDE